ncbi:type VI secretion system-associated protein TagF [Massilia sp. ZL223]|uniref:type VI secretion system-associated protein TagF n=1 Tax=Massilia sp. ZL223 TaxID=2824904 RepID=UPI001B843572|nr:type VI secretion system-associated protein TagF [Massilia sp. ZL223]MBQ5965080.1 type VI secretion system-associated protein TagF [Massilia sp. ZL223]
MECPASAPGFFGKLPSHGDFIGRGLPPAVRDCFDRWLQEALLHGKQSLGAQWMPAWLNGPLWRFVVSAGVCGPQAWAGVLMPSHDRVGRCFPLLLAAGMARPPSLDDCLDRHDAWFASLEELALASLDEGCGLVGLEDGLRLAVHVPGAPRARQRASLQAWSDTAAVNELGGSGMQRRSAWWTDGAAHLPPALAICEGLPAPDAFLAFLDGRWRGHGWCPVAYP